MSIHRLSARLRRLEQAQHVGAPHLVVADRPMEDMEASEVLATWREWVAIGEASVTGIALYLMEPEALTAAGWAAQHVTEH